MTLNFGATVKQFYYLLESRRTHTHSLSLYINCRIEGASEEKHMPTMLLFRQKWHHKQETPLGGFWSCPILHHAIATFTSAKFLLQHLRSNHRPLLLDSWLIHLMKDQSINQLFPEDSIHTVQAAATTRASAIQRNENSKNHALFCKYHDLVDSHQQHNCGQCR